jgi:CheY-like chemotaxis protein
MTTLNTGGDRTNVRRLQPLRVLLVGGDRRYIRVMSFLLSRRGYDVMQTSPERSVEMAQRDRADVVLLDSGHSRVATGRKVSAFHALPSAPAVLVVVGDGEHERWIGVSTIRKWIPVDALEREIEAAAHSRPRPLLESPDSADSLL